MVRVRLTVMCLTAFVMGVATVVLTPTVLTAVIGRFVRILLFILMARAIILVNGVGIRLGPSALVCLCAIMRDLVEKLCIDMT